MEDKLGISVQEFKQRVPGSRIRVGPKKLCGNVPEVRVMKDGDRIASIMIACVCGEEITLICEYDEATST